MMIRLGLFSLFNCYFVARYVEAGDVFHNSASNSAPGTNAVVLGGALNSAIGGYSYVSAGTSNKARGSLSGVSGGYANEVNGSYSGISSGYQNTILAGAVDAQIASGYTNMLSGE